MWKVIAVVGIPLLGFLNMTSFCYPRWCYLSSQELFEHAIAHQSWKMGDYPPGETPASYLAKHSNCCSISDFQPQNSWLNLLFGYKIRYIRVVYRLPQDRIDQFPRDGDFYEAYVEIAPCGRTYHAIGITQTDMK